MNGSRQWCRWIQILWLSKPLQTRARTLRSFRCAVRAAAFVSAMSQEIVAVIIGATGGEVAMGVGVGCGVVLAAVFSVTHKTQEAFVMGRPR